MNPGNNQIKCLAIVRWCYTKDFRRNNSIGGNRSFTFLILFFYIRWPGLQRMKIQAKPLYSGSNKIQHRASSNC